jgi:hypothetical protein
VRHHHLHEFRERFGVHFLQERRAVIFDGAGACLGHRAPSLPIPEATSLMIVQASKAEENLGIGAGIDWAARPARQHPTAIAIERRQGGQRRELRDAVRRLFEIDRLADGGSPGSGQFPPQLADPVSVASLIGRSFLVADL